MADCYFHGQSAPGPCPDCQRHGRPDRNAPYGGSRLIAEAVARREAEDERLRRESEQKPVRGKSKGR